MLGGGAPTGGWVTMYVVAVLGLLAFLGATVQRPRKDIRTFSTDLLDALLPLVAAELSPVERRYGDVLEALARESPGLDAAARAELLAQANGLLADSRALAEKRRGLAGDLADVDDAALAVLNADRDRLLAEAGASDDPVVASSKRQAAQMIDGRIEDARVVARMTARMRAQEEAIAETLAAMASSLTRLNAAPSALRSSEDGGAEWATNALREAAERARAQTRSVEGAVEEVLSLRTGGRGHGGA